jgi:hypothetical protein
MRPNSVDDLIQNKSLCYATASHQTTHSSLISLISGMSSSTRVAKAAVDVPHSTAEAFHPRTHPLRGMPHATFEFQ